MALVVGGVEPGRPARPRGTHLPPSVGGVRRQPRAARQSAVTEHADVVFPVAPVAEKAGTFLDWEGRERPFDAALASQALSDARVLNMLADELGAGIGSATLDDVRRELAEVGPWEGARRGTDPVGRRTRSSGQGRGRPRDLAAAARPRDPPGR